MMSNLFLRTGRGARMHFLVLEYQAACLDTEAEEDGGSVKSCAAASPGGSVFCRSEALIVFFSPMTTMGSVPKQVSSREIWQIQRFLLTVSSR